MKIFLCLRERIWKKYFCYLSHVHSSPNIFKHIEKIASVIRALVDTRPFSHPCMTLVHPFRRHVPPPSVNRDCLEIGLLFYFRKQFASVIKKFPRVTPFPLSLCLSRSFSLCLNPFFFYSSELLRVSLFNIFAPLVPLINSTIR